MDSLHEALLRTCFSQKLVLDAAGRVIAVNDLMCERLGISREQLLGNMLFECFPQPVAQRRQKYLDQAVETRQPCSFRDISESGIEFEAVLTPVMDPDDQVYAVVVVLQDASERKKSEDARYRLATAIEQALEAIILLDTEMRITYVNQAFEFMTGYAQQEAKGRKLEILFQGQEQQCLLKSLTNSLEQLDTWAGRTTNTRKNGELFQAELTISRIRGKRFLFMGYVSIWRDVTDMVGLERQLRQAQKMEAIATLASGIAHDFNNILGPIILHAEVSLTKVDEGSDLQESLEEILNSANRARSLVTQILGLSRGRERDKPVPFRLGTIAKECLKILRPTLSSSITISYSNQSSEDVVVADPTQVHQVLLNLCTNAAHAIGNRPGNLEISLHDARVDAQSKTDFPYLGLGEYVRMSVRDDGVGIAQENLERIFEPFYTTKQENMGTGLGLAVVRNIVSSLGGGIHVETEPGKGSEFQIFIPKCVDCQVNQFENQRSKAKEGQQAHILLVDDDEVTVRCVRDHLFQLGYDVTLCRNGYEALALFRHDPEPYDLVMIDVATPELNGLELAKELKLSRYDLPVILLTSYTEVFSPDKARALGIRAFLRKPCQYDELSSTIAKVLPQEITGTTESNSWPIS